MKECVSGLVSIIIPVYNGERWLSRCLDSIVNQTYYDVEIIVVNDGSVDNSLKVCKEFARRDDRIVILDKKNSGVSETRNTGLKYASGEFIVFVDCDDYIDRDYVYNLVSLMDENIDLGICGWIKEKEDGSIIERCEILDDLYKQDLCLEKLVSLKGVQGYPVSKIFRNGLINACKIRFDKEISIFEDLLFCCEYLKHCKNGRFKTSYCDYHYVIHSQSSRGASVHSIKFDTKWLSEIHSLEKIGKVLEEHRYASRKVHARIALSSTFYINRMFECHYSNNVIQKELLLKLRKNIISVLFSMEGDVKWKLQVLLCAVSPRFEYFIKSKI